MIKEKKDKIFLELAWLVGIIILAVIIEYAVLEYLNINPIISVKIQGLIGLLIIGYGMRASYRIWKSFNTTRSTEDQYS